MFSLERERYPNTEAEMCETKQVKRKAYFGGNHSLVFHICLSSYISTLDKRDIGFHAFFCALYLKLIQLFNTKS
jgi:hypothetical protein